MKLAEHEEIAFMYRKIEWTWNDGGIAAGDDWDAPVARPRRPQGRDRPARPQITPGLFAFQGDFTRKLARL